MPLLRLGRLLSSSVMRVFYVYSYKNLCVKYQKKLPVNYCFVFDLVWFETVSHCVTQAGFKCLILLNSGTVVM